MDMKTLIDSILAASPYIRYVAVRLNGTVTSRQREGLAGASTSESDRYEELIVNPTLLTLVQQRGNIDCGGARYVLIRYGNFFQVVRPLRGGHLSVGIETSAAPLGIVEKIEQLLLHAGYSLVPAWTE